MTDFDLENPWIFAPVVVVVWVGIRVVLGTLVFGKSPFDGLFESVVGGLACALVLVYFHRSK